MAPREACRAAYRQAARQLAHIELEMQRLYVQIHELERQAIVCKDIKIGMRDYVCLDCEGVGEIRHWVAQDESHLEACKTCRGTGMPLLQGVR